MLTFLRKALARWSRDESLTCAECGRARGLHPPGALLYFVPLCPRCYGAASTAHLGTRYRQGMTQYVKACQAGTFRDAFDVRELEREVDDFVFRMRMDSYRHTKEGRTHRALECAQAADAAQAQFDAQKREALAAAQEAETALRN